MSLIGLTVDPNTYDITILRGDDQIVRFTVTTSTGAAQDVTGWSFKFTVKSSLDDAIGSANFQKTTGGFGIALTTPSGGIVDVTLAATDTQTLGGSYYYDLEGTDGSGLAHTVRLARFNVRKDVTTPGSAGQPAGILQGFATGILYVNGYWFVLDIATNQYGAIRLNGGFLDISTNQSATIPFTPTF